MFPSSSSPQLPMAGNAGALAALRHSKMEFLKCFYGSSAVLCGGLGALRAAEILADGEEASAFYQGYLKSTSLPSPALPPALL